jgi:DNA-binding transcriptional regulator of glucitol operon
MSYFMIVAVGFLFATCLQFLFQMYQMRSFNVCYGRLRRKGRVAIGKSRGFFHAGAIVMFAIDSEGIVIDGSYMKGFTMLAKFKDWNYFDGHDVGAIETEDCKKLPVPLRRASLDASKSYNIIMSGGEVKERPGLITGAIQKVGGAIYGTSRKKKA